MDKYGELTWATTPVVVFDLETTGFSRDDRIIEFGAVFMEGSRVIKEMHHLVNPGMKIPAPAMAVHHITDDMVKSAPRWKDVAKECFDFLFQGCPIVAHNISFDARMLAQQINPQHWPRGIFTLCTMELARSRGHKGRAKLSALAEHYNIEQRTEHAAIDDAITTGMLVRQMAATQVVGRSFTKMTGDWADAFLARG